MEQVEPEANDMDERVINEEDKVVSFAGNQRAFYVV